MKPTQIIKLSPYESEGLFKLKKDVHRLGKWSYKKLKTKYGKRKQRKKSSDEWGK